MKHESTTTMMFFSGTLIIEPYMMENPEEFFHCGIMLSYYSIETEGNQKKRLLAFVKNKTELIPISKNKRQKKVKK